MPSLFIFTLTLILPKVHLICPEVNDKEAPLWGFWPHDDKQEFCLFITQHAVGGHHHAWTTTALLCLICRFCQHLCCCCLLPAFVFLYFGVFALPGAALETHAHKRPLIHLCHLKIAGWLQLPEIEDGVTLFFHWSHHQCWKCTASILWCSGLTLLDSYPGVTDMFSLALSVPVRKGFGRAVLNCKPDDKDYK